jgi:glycerophosphoryl diester phosphodiesterase
MAALAAAVLVAGCGDDDGGGSETGSQAEATTTVAAAPEPVPLGEATQPVVVGHRGAPSEHPDNSIAGFEAAPGLGADWVELDVRLSADGDAVLSHDPETEAGSVVTATSTADLAAEGIPTLAEALEVIEAGGIGVDVEVKTLPTEPDYDDTLAVADATVADVEAAGLTVPFVISSFNPSILERVRELTDGMTTVRIFPAGGDAATLAAQVVADGDDGVAVEFEGLTAEDIAAYTGEGLPVWVWTVNDPADAQELVDAGAEAIVTDDPAAIAEALGV